MATSRIHKPTDSAIAAASGRPAGHVAALVVDIGELGGRAPAEVQLFPEGEFRARDGRPAEVDAWRIDPEVGQRVIQRTEAHPTPPVIDYEHQTLYAATSGTPAPAAGWMGGFEYREGQGLYATGVQWTDKARAMIEAGEYRYISPVFAYSPTTGEVLQVLMAGLTNFPALEGMDDLQARAAARFDLTTEDSEMDRQKLIQLLGLNQDATDDQIQKAVAAAKAGADEAAEARKKLELGENDKLGEAVAAAKAAGDELGQVRQHLQLGEQDKASDHVAALKTKADQGGGNPDPAQYVPRQAFEDLRQEVASLKAQQTSEQVEALVQQGKEEGKLTAAMEDWARDLGKKDVAALRSYLDSATPIAALKRTQTGGEAPAGGTDENGLTPDQVAICRSMGIDQAEYAKTLGVAAAGQS